MNLHRASSLPDWEWIAAATRNPWQRIANATRGVITPANFLSVVGALLALVGLLCIARHQWWLGIIFVGSGRFADGLDGMVAEWTGTKSPLGRTIDAGLDKVVALAALIIVTVDGLLPLWMGVGIAAENIANIAAALIGSWRYIAVNPTRIGKLTAAGFWLGLVTLMATPLIATSRWHTPTVELAYIIVGGAVVIGLQATFTYYRVALGKQAPAQLATNPYHPPFTRYIVVRNPKSTDASKVQRRIHELHSMSPESELLYIETRAGGIEPNATLFEAYRDKLGPTTLICVGGGDGTINMVVHLLLHDQQFDDEARKTPILPLWGGNANDLAYMLNGRPSRTTLRRLLEAGAVVPIKPLRCTCKMPDGTTRTYTATSYASFGATAYVTQELEKVIRRRSPLRASPATRLGQETVAVARALFEAPTFSIRESDTTKVIFERIFLNGSRFAKVFGIPLRLTEEQFHRLTVERKHFGILVLHMIGISRKRNRNRVSGIHDAFTILDPTWAQFDGEAVNIAANTHVEVSLSSQPFYALSTRLRHGPKRHSRRRKLPRLTS